MICDLRIWMMCVCVRQQMAKGADCVTTELTEVPAASWGHLELQKKYKNHHLQNLHAPGEFGSMDLPRIFPYWPAEFWQLNDLETE